MAMRPYIRNRRGAEDLNPKSEMQSALPKGAGVGITLFALPAHGGIYSHEVRHERPSSIRNAGCARR
jgi:hypothetical protein